jgi:plasmid stability protein
MQYTLRNVPKALDGALRRRAKREGKSLNETALAVLLDGLGLSGDGYRVALATL